MSLTVKAFLEKDGKPDGEIRRFAIPVDVSSSFAYLCKKIATVFPSLKEEKFTLHWKDPEGDIILFSTDEELMEALAFVADSLFKVYVKVKESKEMKNEPNDAPGEVHIGIVCDGCQGPIRGFRYKCMVCEDFDLCASCEAKGTHKEHNMLRITKPSTGSDHCPAFWGPPPPGPCGHFGHFPGHPKHPGHPRPGEMFGPPPHFRRWMKKFMKRWHSRNAPDCQYGDNDESTDVPEGEPTSEEEYLKSVGRSVSEMLDPLGIEVQVDVEHGGKRVCVGRGRGMGKGFSCSFRGKSWSPDGSKREASPKRKHANKENQQENAAKNAEGNFMGAADEVTIEMEKSCEDEKLADIGLETEKITSATERIVLHDMPKGPDSETMVDPELQCTSHSTRAVPNDTQDKPDNIDSSWTLLNVALPRDAPMQPYIGQTQQAPWSVPISQMDAAEQSARSVLSPVVLYPPTNPAVAEALHQMLSMGFTNDGGWLTSLLEAKKGDIIQVLDAIKPQPGRNQDNNCDYMA